ncbi:MAG TPA: FKBP-type peptidyl-prolyl cis-trans isomerase [Cyclobacteriaceae bacterium]
MKKGVVGLLLFSVICIASCKKTTVTPSIYQQFTADSLKIVNYLHAANINATRHDSVWYVLKETGTGALPTRFNCVLIKYSGYELSQFLTEGVTPTAFQVNNDGLKGPLKGLIGGMQIALKRFPAGSKGTVYIPSYLAYGTGGKTDNSGKYVVHRNQCLVFDIELVKLFDYNVEGNYCYE